MVGGGVPGAVAGMVVGGSVVLVYEVVGSIASLFTGWSSSPRMERDTWNTPSTEHDWANTPSQSSTRNTPRTENDVKNTPRTEYDWANTPTHG